MKPERLFLGAPVVMHLNATHVAGCGWHLDVLMRLEGECWDDAYHATYSFLTSEELVDVVSSEACQRLLHP